MRYVDAADFGAHPVEWVLLVLGHGYVVLTWRVYRSPASSRFPGAGQLSQQSAGERL